MENRIRELREERGMNQEALAGLVGVSQQKISKVERNTEALGIDLLIEISDYFGVTTDYLLCLSEEKRGRTQEQRLYRKLNQYQELVQSFENLNAENRTMVLSLMKAMKVLEEKGQK